MRGGTPQVVPALSLAVGLVLIAGALHPTLSSLADRRRLAPAAATTSAGVPIPAVATHCASSTAADPGTVRWCLPGRVAPRELARWYDRRLPAGRDAGDLRWCLQQWQSDGSRRLLWSAGGGLVGYQLPSSGPRAASAVVEVVRLPARPCPAVARATRTGASA